MPNGKGNAAPPNGGAGSAGNVARDLLSRPADTENEEDVTRGVRAALALEAEPLFAEGLAERLTQLGTPCAAGDVPLMLEAVKERYARLLGVPCPRTVLEWIRGTPPGVVNRRNHYELCCALEMDDRQTADFFRERFLTAPYIVKSRVDAAFLYGLYNKRPYADIRRLLERADAFAAREEARTSTAEIRAAILRIRGDEAFLRYLSEHCYTGEQQYLAAKREIRKEIAEVRRFLLKYTPEKDPSEDRLNSLTVETLIGYKYQTERKRALRGALPKRFTESLPNDVTLGRILNGEKVSYELLRKTLILLKLFNFYNEADNTEPETAAANLSDFRDETDEALAACGFAPLFIRHPFDCLILYCANSDDPIDLLHNLILRGRN